MDKVRTAPVAEMLLIQAENEARENLGKWQEAERRFLVMAQAAEALEAEVVRLKGLQPEFPPYPPEGHGLPRYGLRWNGPEAPLAVPMADGYWTPFHLAQRQLFAIQRLSGGDAEMLEALLCSQELWLAYGSETDPAIPVPEHHREMERKVADAISKALSPTHNPDRNEAGE